MQTTYKLSSNILLSRLTPYAEEIIWDHECGFYHSRSTTDHVFCIHPITKKKWKYIETVLQLFIDQGRPSIILSLSLVPDETGKSYQNMSE
jgi:hypothetical protein